MKRIIRISWEGRSLNHDKFCWALLQYRNTPSHRDGLSPAQKLYGRPVQDILPAHHRSFSREWHQKAASVEQQEEQLFKTEHYYNQHAHALPEIQVGSNVAIHNSKTKLWATYGVVTYVGPHRRYYVKTKSGRVLMRNRCFLRRHIPASIPASIQCQLTSYVTPTEPTSASRRSTRQRHPPNRLIEDPNWK